MPVRAGSLPDPAPGHNGGVDAETSRALDRTAEVVRRHAGRAQPSARLGLRLSHVEGPTPLGYQRYSPSLSLVLAGRKRSIIGDDDQVWGREHFLITPVELPVVAGVVETAPGWGFVSLVWRLDPVVVGDVAATMARPPAGPRTQAARLGTWTPELADAVSRYVRLLDAPQEIPVLENAFAREVVLRLLQTDQAPRILAALGSPEGRLVRDAVRLLTERMAEPWTMTTLASAVHAGESTLFGRFKQVTGMSPLMFLKRTRLGEARRRMVLLDESAAEAGARVGYRSASHFSRDYRREFGSPPAADAARARAELASATF